MAETPPLLAVQIERLSSACPYLNKRVEFQLRSGEVLWLRGASGAGKSYTCLHLAGLATLPGCAASAHLQSPVIRARACQREALRAQVSWMKISTLVGPNTA